MHCSLPVPLSMGFLRQEYWSGLPFPSPGNLPDPGIEPVSLTSLALAGEFFTTSTIWEAWGSQFSSVQSFSRVRHFVTPWTAARQASLPVTKSRSLLRVWGSGPQQMLIKHSWYNEYYNIDIYGFFPHPPPSGPGACNLSPSSVHNCSQTVGFTLYGNQHSTLQTVRQ